MRHELDVLFGILALDHFFVVEGEPGLGTVRVLPQNVNGLLLGEVAEAAGKRSSARRRLST